jgi:hypothetical protein
MKKALSIGLALILVANLVLLALVKGYFAYFWLVLGISALVAYKVIPKVK